MVVLAVVSVVFALVTAVIALRFMALARQLVDNIRLDHREGAVRLDAARSAAFSDAMTALERAHVRASADQSQMLERTVDMVAGPQSAPGAGEPFKVDEPSLDARPAWMPDDEFDYTGLGIDPTDELLPDPPLEPAGNEGRATMVRPGEGLRP